MIYLLDTNVISEFRRPSRTHPNVRRWATRVSGGDLVVSAMTIFELELGAELKKRRDPAQGTALQSWIERDVIGRFEQRIIPIDLDVARRAATLHVPNPRPERDAFIAATALVHGLAVVTRNVRDFAGLGVPVLNPWEPDAG